jgi:LPXTG-motif cell wall-anchored protein
MRNRLLGALTAGSLLLLPAGAMAQEDPCYADPTAPECIGSDDGEVGTDDGEVADDGTEVDAEVVARTSTSTGELARTGLETGTLVALFVGLLAAGGALLVATRRRRTT